MSEGPEDFRGQPSTHRAQPQKSWSELHQAVRDIRHRIYGLSTRVPSDFVFRTVKGENGSTKTRLYFLNVPDGSREATVFYTDVGADVGPACCAPDARCGQFATAHKTLLAHSLLESNFNTLPMRGKVSKEEQLQWERKRLVTLGITTYELHVRTGKFLFPACSSLFYCQDSGNTAYSYFPTELKSSCSSGRLNPQFSPANADLVAFVANGDIWVQHLESGHEQRLTFARKGCKSLADDPLTAGIPSYVIQEEFHRFTGFWWQPQTQDGVYRILYEEVDESEVEILYFPPAREDDRYEEYRFPRAGTPNAKSSLKMLQFHVDESGHVQDLQYLHLQDCLHMMFSMEYVVRVGWTCDGKRIWAQLLDRRQQSLVLILIPLPAFKLPSSPIDDCLHNHVGVQGSQIAVLIKEETKVWINVNDILHFFKNDSADDTVSFIWASEETGFRHLYFISVQLHANDGRLDGIYNSACDGLANSKIVERVALTWGEWEVMEKQVWVDELRNLVYFTGFKDGPLEKHFYVVSIKEPGIYVRLTDIGLSHTVTMNKESFTTGMLSQELLEVTSSNFNASVSSTKHVLECTMFVTVYSSMSTLPGCQLFSLKCPARLPSSANLVSFTSIGYLLEPSVPESHYDKPELFSHKIQSGETLYSLIFKPAFMEAGRKYPAVMSVYGGPEVQLVNNSFKGMRQLRLHMLAAHGYMVIVVDSRGSRYRGLKFESYIKNRMGTVEIGDQVEMLQWLAEETGYIDVDRVAIHGWSYGGYLSLMALAQRPDIFKVAIAGAPVTSWNLYDTAYTERYMGLPSDNLYGYKMGSVLSYINSFPNEMNRLLIIHGLLDENVHFQHSKQLIDALIKAAKPYQLQLYPQERHSLRHLDASEHYETTLLSFLQHCL